ncbi:ankyrin repeat domain-containing protein 39 [Syngnathoides biaculeatus]|uniref:ankyrin repeat domain-containing protein 39 n=1 Tax=Syngnathoides biaculeatus TaxID=300417 RepID=UPI002ADE6089|nr:ankyrin repeat domain-containing protein 39 [Syngnathoides biaculeatus]XP_061672892.1 ankyrin repeat domain-containing protein 39 [Syngnathoides biaculeatus]
MASDGEHCCSCCTTPLSPGVYQTVNEMDFQRGIWSAAIDGDLKRVQSMIQKGINANLRDSAGYTALHYASRNGHLTVSEFLLEYGACVSPRTPGGGTPLHRAAFCGHVDIVRLLLRHKADPMASDDDGATPLHKAAEQGHEKVCVLLLEVCPTLCSQKNKRLQLPYHMASQEHLRKLLKRFL